MSKKTGKKLVIVESPVKARTIGRFLGSDYMVESCMGHVRDLPDSSKDLPESVRKKPWARLGVDVENNFHPFYCIPKDKKATVQKLKEKMKSAPELILATDEDREGESISWHLTEILKPGIPVKRMVFHEITKPAIQSALKNFRPVDSHLVQAQEARRILDRLVGYSLSPVLWKKITRGLSAGRVQSVAVSLISQREMERLDFQKTKYWDVSGELKKNGSPSFPCRLTEHKKKPLVRSSDFDSKTGRLKNKQALLMTEKEALKLKNQLKGKMFHVVEVKKRQVVRKPPPPFITSTLQQEGNRKLGFSSRQTMGLAQKLYEQGLITYMRTDSTFLSSQALRSARTQIHSLYGKENLPPAPRVYRAKAKGAQEAHEAVRPAGNVFTLPEKTRLNGPALSLYTLIWKRTLASQMKDCIQNQVQVQMKVDQSLFQSTGTSMAFPGFYLVYKEHIEETELPSLKKGDRVKCVKAKAEPHETKPPARYTEASLIQKLEKEGVGRPSTYASIISTIQDRDYVKKEKNSLIPTFTALVVNRFLHKNFPDYVDTQFTAEMEKDLDDIARGKKNYVRYLKSVYLGPKGLRKKVEEQDKAKGDKKYRSLNLKGFEDYAFNVGPFGAYVSQKKGDVSASLPIHVYPGEITKEIIERVIDHKVKGGRSLGKDPKTGQEVFLVVGKYGPYVRKDNHKALDKRTNKTKASAVKSARQKKPKPKTMSISPFFDENSITLKGALKLLELPKSLGHHPETGKEIKKSLGRFGPYIVHEGEFRSVPKDLFFDMDLSYAVKRLKEPKRRSSRVLKELGLNPKNRKPVQLMKGKFGPYLKNGGKNYSLPADVPTEDLKLPVALKLMAGNVGTKKTTRQRKAQ